MSSTRFASGVTVPSNSRRSVFLLWHTHVLPGGDEDSKLLGVYTSRRGALAAEKRLGGQPGFAEAPEGFEVSEYVLNRDEWREGFVTLDHSGQEDGGT